MNRRLWKYMGIEASISLVINALINGLIAYFLHRNSELVAVDWLSLAIDIVITSLFIGCFNAPFESSMKEIGVGHRYNGYGGFGDTFKGNFRAEDRGNYLLFVNSSSPYTIFMEREKGKNIYLSDKDSEKTKALYQELITAIAS